VKPESIERDLAGIGSVHPEELREHRRKLLTIERNGLQTQLDLLEERPRANRTGMPPPERQQVWNTRNPHPVRLWLQHLRSRSQK